MKRTFPAFVASKRFSGMLLILVGVSACVMAGTSEVSSRAFLVVDLKVDAPAHVGKPGSASLVVFNNHLQPLSLKPVSCGCSKKPTPEVVVPSLSSGEISVPVDLDENGRSVVKVDGLLGKQRFLHEVDVSGKGSASR